MNVTEFIKRVGGKDNTRGCAEHLSVVPNEFNKFGNTGARMQDYLLQLQRNGKVILASYDVTNVT